MSRFASITALWCFVLSFIVSTRTAAQITNMDETTLPQTPGVGHEYIKMLGETVNPANGSVSLRIDIPTPKGRGLSIPFAITYSSTGVQHAMGNLSGNGGGGWGTDTGLQNGSGWSFSLPTLTAVQAIAATYLQGPPPQTQDCYYYYSYIVKDWSGAAHQFTLEGAQAAGVGGDNCQNPPSNNLYSADDFFQATTTAPQNPFSPNPVIAAGPDGTVYYLPTAANVQTGNNSGSLQNYWTTATSIEDRNGNLAGASFNVGTNGVLWGSISDSVRSPVVKVTALSGNTNTITVSGLSAPYIQTWQSIPVSFSVNPIEVGPYPCGSGMLGPDSSTNYVIQSLKLPNGMSFQFYYDAAYGLLKKIVYPTGGYVAYTWGLNPQAEFINLPAPPNFSVSTCPTIYDYPAIVERDVSYDGTNIAEKQTFSYSTTWGALSQVQSDTWTSKQSTVTTYDNIQGTSFQTTHTYAPRLASIYGYQAAPMEQTTVYKDFNGNVLKTVTKAWIDQFLLGCQLETMGNGSTSGVWYSYGTAGQMTDKKEYDYGSVGSAPCQQQLGTGVSVPPSGTPTRETAITYKSFPTPPSFSHPTIYDRPLTVKAYGKAANGNAYLASETDYAYDNYATGIVPVTATGHDDTGYPASYTNRGNLTSKTVKCFAGSTTCVNSVTTYTYDQTGQLLSVTDPCGNTTCSDMTGSNHTTAYSYMDSYTVLSGGANTPYTPSGNTNAYLTSVTNSMGQNETFTYDYNNGQLTASRDQNDITASRPGTTYIYNDALSRLTQGNYPDGGQTEYTYDDVAPSPSVTTCQNIDGAAGAACSASSPASGWKTSIAIMDGIGHVVQTQMLSDPLGTDFTDTTYDGQGRVLSRSNPHRSTSLSSDGTTKYLYDALGRPTQTTNADGSIATTTYDQTNPSSSGTCSTVMDEVGNSRQSCVDGLGRLTGVWEDPGASPHLNYATTYSYDALNNLLSVAQNGSDSTKARLRSFTYDSLSRLLCAANPEIQIVTCPTSGTSFPGGAITYSYDVNGNLLQKKSPLPNQTVITSQVTTNYKYDVLNRLTQKSFAGMSGQPVIRFGYDGTTPSGCTPTSITGATNLIGRRSSMCDGVGSAAWSYDPMGRILTQQNTTHGITKRITYLHLLDGEVYSLDYPDGKAVSFSPYGNGLTDGVEDDIFSFQGSHDFAPNGSPYAVDYGPATNASAASQTFYYNKRFQSAEMYLFDTSDFAASYCYDFHVAGGQTVGDVNLFCTFSTTSPGDNGNLYQSMNNLDATGNRTANYTYDALNRVLQANTTGPNWGESYVIDAWGNLTNRNPVAGKTNYEPLAAPTTPAPTNHLVGFTYDAAGNVINDGVGDSYTYDAENRLVTAGGVTYSYDGDGNRVIKSNGTIYWRGSDGETLAESGLTGTVSEEYVYINGKREVRMDRPSGTVHLYFTDLLGSTTLITDVNGNPEKQSDYYPFGGEIPISGSDPNHYKFTGKERDAESGLDDFGARYNASTMGRFMTPDPLGGTLVDPQTLNRYSYVVNNPLRYSDPTGLYTCKDDNNQCKSKLDVQFETARKADLARGGDAARAAAAYGDPTKDNHVSVGFSDKLDKKGEGGDTKSTLGADDKGKLFAQSDVTISSKLSGTAFEAAVGHEGSHVADAQDVVSSISPTTSDPYFKVGADITRYQSEQRAYAVTDSILKSSNENWHFACGVSDCVLGTGMQMLAQRPGVIDRIMANSPLYRSNGQPLSPTNQGGSVILTVPH